MHTRTLPLRQSAHHRPQAPGLSSCADATTYLLLSLTNKGILQDVTHLKPGAQVEIENADTRIHHITITPPGLLSRQVVLLKPGQAVLLRTAPGPRRVMGGTIIDGQGPRRTVHDIVICP